MVWFVMMIFKAKFGQNKFERKGSKNRSLKINLKKTKKLWWLVYDINPSYEEFKKKWEGWERCLKGKGGKERRLMG